MSRRQDAPMSPQRIREIAKTVAYASLPRPLLAEVRRRFSLCPADAITAIRLANGIRAATAPKPKQKRRPPVMESGGASETRLGGRALNLSPPKPRRKGAR